MAFLHRRMWITQRLNVPYVRQFPLANYISIFCNQDIQLSARCAGVLEQLCTSGRKEKKEYFLLYEPITLNYKSQLNRAYPPRPHPHFKTCIKVLGAINQEFPFVH